MRNLMVWFSLLTMFSLSAATAFAGNPEDPESISDIPIQVRYVAESDDVRTIVDAMSLDWSKAETSRVNYGSTRLGHWFQFEIPEAQVAKGENLVLEIHYPTIDHLAFYVVNEQGRVTLNHVTGTDFQFDTRPIWDDDYSFAFNPQRHGKQVFIYARTSNSLQMPVRLFTESDFYAKEEWNLILWGAFYGTMLVMALYSLLNGLIIRERMYFYYSIYVLSAALFVGALNGHGFAYLWPHAPHFNDSSITLFFCLYSGFGIAFAMALLNTRRFNPRLYRLGLLVNVGSIVLGTTSLITQQDFGHVSTYHALAFALVMLVLGIKSVKDGHFLGWYFLIGWSILLFSIGLFSLNLLGYFPANMLIYHSKEIGSVIEIIVFSLAMSAIYRHEKAERSKINNTLEMMKQRLEKRINLVNNKSGFLEVPQLEKHLKDIRDLDRRIHSEMGRILVISVMVIDKATRRSDYIALGDCLKGLFRSRVTVFPFKTNVPELPGEVTVLLFPLHNKFEAEDVIARVEQWNPTLGDQYDLHFGYAISHLTDQYDVDYIEESFHNLEEALHKKSMSYSIDDSLTFQQRNNAA